MRVYTYYEKINRELPGTMQVWKDSWTKFGWEPIVLGEEDFKKHPSWEFYDAATDKLPTFNSRIYERACYRRWLAMAPFGGGLMTDYDILNKSFTPENLRSMNLTDLTILCESRVPCVVFGTGPQFQRAALEFARYVPGPRDIYHGNPFDSFKGNDGKPLVEDMTILRHVSDMHILGRTGEPLWFQSRPICCDVRHLVGHEGTSLIHCSAYGSHGQDRVKLMRSLMV